MALTANAFDGDRQACKEAGMTDFIAMNWRGRPLTSHEVIVNLIANTKTRSGLTVRSEIDTNSYPKGLVVSDTDFDAIRLIRDEFHGDWNYAIEPLNNEGISSQRRLRCSKGQRWGRGWGCSISVVFRSVWNLSAN